MPLFCVREGMCYDITIQAEGIRKGKERTNMETVGSINHFWTVTVDIANIFQFFCTSFLIVVALNKRVKEKSEYLPFIGKVLLVMAISMSISLAFSALTFYYHILMGVGTWLSYLAGLVFFAAFFCDFPFNAKVVTATCVYAEITVVIELGACFGRVLELQIDGFNSLYTKVAADMLLLLAAKIFYDKRMGKYQVSIYAVVTNFTCSALVACSVIVYDLVSTRSWGMGDIGQKVFGLVSLLFLFLYIIVTITYLMTYSICREQDHVIRLTTDRQLYQSTEQLLSVADRNIEELHRIRHDINNQFSYLNVLLQKEDYEHMKGYLEEVLGTFAKPVVKYVDSGNRVLDAILSMENAKAEAMGISFNCMTAVPKELPFRDLDLCNLLTNLIDNALEACESEQIPNAEVIINLKLQGEYLYLLVQNPTKKTRAFFENGMVTTKVDKIHHGKGHYIVNNIIRKYEGHQKVDIKDGFYRVELLLDQNTAKELRDE